MAEEKQQKLIGDFNCKAGNLIRGNTEQVTKGSSILMKMINRKQLYLLNTDRRCKGVFTRTQGTDPPSVLDYAMIRNTDIDVKSMIIDEDKEMIPHYYKEEEGKVKQVNTDHYAVVIAMDYMLSTNNTESTKIVTKNWIYKIQEANRRWKSQ